MVVFSNRRLGAGVQLVLPPEIASAILRSIAGAARPFAQVRWEHELVRWLESRATDLGSRDDLDVSEIAWSPDHFEPQQQFVVAAIQRACEASEHAATLERWSQMIEAHPRDSVQFGRLWQWQPTA